MNDEVKKMFKDIRDLSRDDFSQQEKNAEFNKLDPKYFVMICDPNSYIPALEITGDEPKDLDSETEVDIPSINFKLDTIKLDDIHLYTLLFKRQPLLIPVVILKSLLV